MKPHLGDQVHYVERDRRTDQPLPCRLAFISEVPRFLNREPLDGCPNGTDGEWIASLVVVGRTGFAFAGDADYLTPHGSNAPWAEDAATSWHVAADCEEAS
ncbi:hypothetical protein [Streptomyces ortus]|uniref:Uncharacterized protein n=1 Tax=Streptomyces ortus TaxID=2867268 RepID=A0ABT3UWS1_9ACTN|nr:hypothetical protein [Streptomyces ortus]MCX4232016.1 hypothetical protein [Streptomyces ortus]